MYGSNVEDDVPLVQVLDGGLEGKLVLGRTIEVKGGLGETGG